MGTRQEQVANSEIRDGHVREKWGRARRNRAVLDPWCNERAATIQKTWKIFRENQYRVGGRGQKHTVVIDNSWAKKWNFEKYCNAHDIPFCINEICHLEKRTQYKKAIWTVIGNETVKRLKRVLVGTRKKWIEVEQTRPKYGYIYEDLPTPRHYAVSITDGWELVWWSNKDIGIEYILNKNNY
jgi:hypothetical protein